MDADARRRAEESWAGLLLHFFETGRLFKHDVDLLDRLKADAIAQAVQAEREERRHEIGSELSNNIAQVIELVRHNGVLLDTLNALEAQLREREREHEDQLAALKVTWEAKEQEVERLREALREIDGLKYSSSMKVISERATTLAANALLALRPRRRSRSDGR